MLLGKGSSLAVGRGRGFIIKSSARVESLGTALASSTLQAKSAWGRVRLNKFINVYICSSWGKEKKKKRSKSIPVVHSSSPFQSTDY